MKKRPYRAVPVKNVDVADIRERLSGQRLVVGVDVAKVDFVATLMTERGENLATVKWKHRPCPSFRHRRPAGLFGSQQGCHGQACLPVP